MTRSFTTLLIISLVFAGGYFYQTAKAVCPAPLSYRLGTLDPKFGLSFDEARSAISNAESLWEDATGQNLFTYDESAEFTIHFIYDDRQELTDDEHELRDELEARKDMSEEVRIEYESLLSKYEELKITYEERTSRYEQDLKAHNAEVEKWNERGGAPPAEYEKLNAEQRTLANEQKALREATLEINQLAKEINELGEKGDVLVSTYNSVVELYNNRFNTEREFTQGEYQGDNITIYQYENQEELEIVLAHELGHALSLDHVGGDTSVMYHLMDKQTLEEGLTPEDLEEFDRICGEREGFALLSRWW